MGREGKVLGLGADPDLEPFFVLRKGIVWGFRDARPSGPCLDCPKTRGRQSLRS